MSSNMAGNNYSGSSAKRAMCVKAYQTLTQEKEAWLNKLIRVAFPWHHNHLKCSFEAGCQVPFIMRGCFPGEAIPYKLQCGSLLMKQISLRACPVLVTIMGESLSTLSWE